MLQIVWRSAACDILTAMGELSSYRAGWIGTGVMGQSMAGHLLNAGAALTVYSRTQAKARPLIDRGATCAGTPREVADASDVVFTMVGFPADVREVYFGDGGVLPAARRDQPLVDMTTTLPALAVEIAATASARGARALDAPVSGGDVGARNGTLSIMVGGEAEALDRA